MKISDNFNTKFDEACTDYNDAYYTTQKLIENEERVPEHLSNQLKEAEERMNIYKRLI